MTALKPRRVSRPAPQRMAPGPRIVVHASPATAISRPRHLGFGGWYRFFFRDAGQRESESCGGRQRRGLLSRGAVKQRRAPP
jgi:hypothetical protein